MTRIIDKQTGRVHLRNPADDRQALCGETVREREQDLLWCVFGKPMKETSESVNCPKCAKVYCAVKNEPCPSVNDAAMNEGIYAAVQPDTKGEENERDGEGYGASADGD